MTPLILLFANQKGGTGKTTSAVSVAAQLSRSDVPTVLLDLDPQGHIAPSLGLDQRADMSRLLRGEAGIEDVMRSAEREGGEAWRSRLRVVTSDDTLAAVEREIAADPLEAIHRLSGHADAFTAVGGAVVVDCPPQLGILSLNAMVFAARMLEVGAKGGIVAPVGAGSLDVAGLGALLRTLDRLRQQRVELPLVAVVPTLVEPNTIAARDLKAALEARFGDLVTYPVRKSVRFREAPSYGLTIQEYDAAGRGASDYEAATADILRLALGGRAEPANQPSTQL